MTTTATANHRPVPTVVLEGIPSVTGGAVNNSSSNNNNNNASSDDDSAGAAGGDVLMALPPRFSSSAASVATTQLASDVGSVQAWAYLYLLVRRLYNYGYTVLNTRQSTSTHTYVRVYLPTILYNTEGLVHSRISVCPPIRSFHAVDSV